MKMRKMIMRVHQLFPILCGAIRRSIEVLKRNTKRCMKTYMKILTDSRNYVEKRKIRVFGEVETCGSKRVEESRNPLLVHLTEKQKIVLFSQLSPLLSPLLSLISVGLSLKGSLNQQFDGENFQESCDENY